MNTQQLETQFEEARGRAQSIHSRLSGQAQAEGRPLGPGEQEAITRAVQEAQQLKARVDKARVDQSMYAAIECLTGGPGSGRASVAVGGGRDPLQGTIGEQFLRSDTYEWLKKTAGSRPSGAWTSPSSELFAATLTTDSASGGDLVVPDFRPGILPGVTRPLTLARLLASGTTDSNLIQYMKETTFTNAANTVAEGATKPESTLIFDAVSDPVRKIAHWVPTTEEMLEDVSGIRSYIDARLRLGVELELDDQLLNGTTTAPDIVGFLNRTGLATTITRVAEVNADAILSQIIAIWTATNLQPDGIVLNPAQWKTILLTKDTQGLYIGGGPFASPHAPSLWGLPVALTPAIVAGTALVGCYKTSAQVFYKGNLRVEASNAHSDFFVKNLVAIRAELRAALAVYRASAFGKVENLN